MKKASPKNIRFAFFGTSDIAVWALEELATAGFNPTLIITASDKPAGRKMELTPPPAKEWAMEKGIDFLQPMTVKGNDEFSSLLRNSEWDAFVVIDYGKILPKEIIDIPRKGMLNIHPSLLPKLRGASPIRSAILEDMKETGVSIMLMDEEVDHGPILSQARIEFTREDPPSSRHGGTTDGQRGWPLPYRALREILAREGGKLLAETLPEWLSGKITPVAQKHEEATYTKKFEKKDAEINLADDPYKNLLKIRAFDENPNAFYFHEAGGKKIRVLIKDAEIRDEKLLLTRVIPEGKKEIAYEVFRSGLGA